MGRQEPTALDSCAGTKAEIVNVIFLLNSCFKFRIRGRNQVNFPRIRVDFTVGNSHAQ